MTETLLNKDSLKAKRIFILFLKWIQIVTVRTKNIIKNKNSSTWLSRIIEKFFLKQDTYKVKGKLAISIPKTMISSVKKLL